MSDGGHNGLSAASAQATDPRPAWVRATTAFLSPGGRLSLVVPVILAIVLIAFPALGGSAFDQRAIVLIGIYALAVSGVNISYGFVGDVQFAQVAFLAIGAYATGIAATRGVHSIVLLILLSGASAAVIGFLLALPAMRMKGWSLAMVSFFLVLIIPDAANIFQKWTGGATGIYAIPNVNFFGSVIGSKGLYEVLAVVLIIWLALMRNLVKSRYGSIFKITREGNILTSSVGISSFRIRASAYVISAIAAGIGGCFLALVNGAIDPSQFSLATSIAFIAASVFGGSESVFGCLFGAAALQLGPLYSAGFQQYSVVIYGAFLIVIVLLLPEGVTGVGLRLLARVTGRDAGPAGAVETGDMDFRGETPGDLASTLEDIESDLVTSRAISVRGVSKRFGGLKAVSDVSLECLSGEVTALIGSNGSGKTTLLNMISGFGRPDEGSVWMDDERLDGLRPSQVVRSHQVARTFQTPKIPRRMTALEVASSGRFHLQRCSMWASTFRLPSFWRTRRDDLHAAEAALKIVGLEDVADVPATRLAFGTRRLLEVARCVCAEPSALLLDEPASGLSTAEVSRLATLLRAIAAQGTIVVVVEHNLQFVNSVADKIYVCDQGQVIASGTPAEVASDPEVAASFLGGVRAALEPDDAGPGDLSPERSGR
ncbi:MAG TPA: branched-chain amino acid ABC transporter ATP-binding protein/permease [Solirubrobacteraceae bacterium]|jgi:branched-chain amino acid transport system permease protein